MEAFRGNYMKASAKNLLLLAGFMGTHAVLRILFVTVLSRYEMSLPHCCGASPSWLLWLIKGSDLFFYWPGLGSPLLSDLMWGCVALAIYLWAEKRRNRKREATRIIREAQAGVWPLSPKPSQPVT